MRYFTLYLLLAISLTANSQNRVRRGVHNSAAVIENAILNRYIDSISIYRHRLDSVYSRPGTDADGFDAYDTVEEDPRLYRLFTPLNFYPDLANRRFSLSPEDILMSKEQRSIDNTLLNIYLYHPQLVRGVYKADKLDSASDERLRKVKVDTTPAVAAVAAPVAEEKGFNQVDLVIKKPNFWKFSGDYYFQTMQNYYSKNWYQGGESNYSVLTRATIRANYNNKQKVKWENTLEMQLGFQTNKSDTVHSVKTSTDLLRYTGKFGLQASKKWYYTLQLVASSQFMRSFAANSDNVNSDFLSPLNLNISLGMDYSVNWLKNKLTGSIHIAPFAFDYRYVDRLALAPRNGIDAGHHGKSNYGSTLTLNGKWNVANNIVWNTRLYAFTSYKHTDIQWENTIDIAVSKLIKMTIYLYPRFDDSNVGRKDDGLGYFQFKEYTSFGLSYSF